jgi:aryl-alcohol dehydrogenase-like predicted oxidoreductase
MRIALGTVQFGLFYGIANETGQVSRAESKAMLQLASASGIDTLDTAVAYGESEVRLGEAGVQNFNVITKLPAIPASCTSIGDWVREQVNLSLSRLGLPKVYGILVHRSADLIGKDGGSLWYELEALHSIGLVEKIGVSIYSPTELEKVFERFSVDLVQAPLNLVDRRLVTSGWLDRLKERGVELHTRSAFLQGLLLMPMDSLPPEYWRWRSLFFHWYQWLFENNYSALEACLAYPLSFQQVDRVVVGADSLQQLRQIIGTANIPMVTKLPNLGLEDEFLINPAKWAEIGRQV